MFQPGLVSTIIPVYNRPRQLADAVGSVLAQDYRPLEIIIVDDGSTDETPEIIASLVREHGAEVRATRRSNGGVGLARESGRELARGEFIQYLDSDDALLPMKFSTQVRALRDNPSCGVAYGKTQYRLANGEIEDPPRKRIDAALPQILPAFLLGRLWETATPLFRREVCDAAGPWSALKLEEDWEYDCRVGALGTKLCFCDLYVAEHRDHQGTRLSRGRALDPVRLGERARAHAAVYSHARRAGVRNHQPEMQRFSRELFLLARQCGAARLTDESRMLLDLSEEASRDGGDVRLYRRLASLFGFSLVGAAACASDTLRPLFRRDVGESTPHQ